MSSSSGAQKRDTDQKRAELLYLITNFLKASDHDEISKIGDLLAGSVSDGALGITYAWNGESRPATVEDFARKHKDLPVQHLPNLLDNLIAYRNLVNPSLPRTIMYPTSMESELSTPATEKNEIYDSLVQKLLRHTSELRMLRSKIQSEKEKVEKISNSFNSSNSDETAGSKIDTDRCQDRRIMESTALSASGSSCEDLPSEGAQKSNSLVLKDELHVAGIDRERKRLLSSIENDELAVQSLTIDIEKTLESIKSGRRSLLPATYKGRVENTLGWLMGAQLGICKLNGGFGSHLGRACTSSASRVKEAFSTRYRYLWSSRGHRIDKPVYCAVFDKSGQYILSGADDRTVKIWDYQVSV